MPIAKDAVLPLSSVQQVVWLDQSLHRELPLYHIGAAILLEGELDVDCLERAVALFASRHDALRLTLVQDDEGVSQRIADAVDPSLSVFDYADNGVSEKERNTKALQHLQAAFTAPIDVHRGPLWDMCLVRVAPGRHYWMQRYHHIVADGSSVALAITGIARLYNALRDGTLNAAQGGSSYLPYIDRDQAYAHSARFESDRSFWRNQFKEIPPALLPRRQGAALGAAPSGQHAWILQRALYDKMLACAARHEASSMHFMLGLISLYFARTADLDEVVIGISVQNRGAGDRDAIGMFSAMIPVRIPVVREHSFAQHMQAVAGALRQCYRHRRFPISHINRDLELWRGTRGQLFDVSLSFESFDVECVFGSARPNIQALHHGFEQTPLAVFVRDYCQDQDVAVELNFNTAHLDGAAADDLQARWALLLNAALDNPDQPIGSMPLLSARERHQVLTEFNDTKTAYRTGLCLHELFEAQVKAMPEATALVVGDVRLTYLDLNARANRLAHHLRDIGVTPDARVAVCLERGVGMVVSLLAILKAGGAYVPLDPGLPEERLADVLRDCAPLALISEGVLVAPLTRVQQTARVLDLQGSDAPWESKPATDPARAAVGLGEQHLAYIIYTSGSTGRPKGVMIEHRSIVNRLFWMQEAYSLDKTDAVLQKTPYGFDVSVWEFFWPLCFGSTLVMARPQGHKDPAYLIETIRRHGITTLHFVPSMLQLFLAHEDAASCDSLKRIVCSGEALPAALAKRCLDQLPHASLYNLYGPTEAAVDVTALTCDRATLETGMSIGRPIANTAIYILGRARQPVAPGMVGELYIGGVQVARGYWNRADLSAERFIADPFSNHPHARLYKTGDLGRWRADGSIEYLGRNDFQVKIRGLRIELGEVEAQLAGHPGVRESIVLAKPDQDGEQRLVAYYTGPALLPAQALRSYLSERLPDYMVPAAYVRLECWPTTANGKLDRKALPEPEHEGRATRTYAAPQGETEAAIALFWQDLLGVAQVGRHDHFFELGGHSLKAAQLVSRIRTRFAVELPLMAVFSHPVLTDLAARVSGASGSDMPAVIPLVTAGSAGEHAPLSYAQQGLWLMAQLEQASAAYHLAGGLYLEGPLDRVALRRALERILDRHDVLRTNLRTVNGQAVQVVAPRGALFALTLHDLGTLDDPSETLRSLAHEEAGAPFDLENGPLVRGRLVRTGADTHVLLITMHHIVSDGWSIGLLFNEISALYSAFTRGQPDPLPALAFQYADYAVWQRGWLQGEVLTRQLDFWSGYQAGAPQVLELPADRQRPAVQDFAGDCFDFSLDAELTEGLKSLSERHGCTLYMTLLASWAIVLARLSGQTDLVIGSPVANRPHHAFETLIGCFINTLALRIDLSGSPTVAELLARVKDSTLAAQSHQDVSFEQVVERINPVRSLAHHPLFQVAFTWQNAPEGALGMAGLKAAGFATPQAFSKTDCWLVAGEVQGERGPQITATLNYATALFDRATVERTISQWNLALEAMVADDSQPVAGMMLLTAAERQTMLADWNDSACDFPREPLLPQWFAEQAARTPDAIALVQGPVRLTYAQLNSQANRLAHHLISLGVAPESRIAIGMRRSPEMVIGLLAILKAGAAYVPLDPSYPAERLAYLLADSAPVALLTQSALREAWGVLPAGLARIDIDADRAVWQAQPDTDPPVAARPDNLAYMIYTSGSTGHPKGVMIEHTALLNYLHWAVRAYRPTKGSIVSSSVAFDATITSLYTPLLCGASVTLLEEGDEIEGLESCLRSPQGAGLVKITPAHLDLLGRGIEASGSKCAVDVFVIGGETLAPSTVQLWQRIAPGARLVNEYGPTETVVGCASYEVDASVLTRSVPIGRPIANMRMYVLDANRQPVPLGVTGELYIGGAGVGRGYWQRPELSAERFIADPFSSAPNARLYKTGDLGRWRADGQLEYLGRNDFQVKIRGFRIELGEIEAHLASCPGVREAAVLAREDAPREKRLVAYYSGAETLGATELRDHLCAHLPDYMLPGAYLRLEVWPLTPNGKLDRAALPKPGEEAYAGEAYAAPQGELETKLAQIWAQLLDMTRIGRHDDFFLLDGNSLLAVQLVARVRQEFGVDTGLTELFAHPVLADFAACIAGAASAASADLLPIPAVDRKAPLPTSFAQQRLWFLAQLDQGSAAYHIAGGLTLHGRLDRAALAMALDRIVQRHEALRTRFREGDAAPIQVVDTDDARFALRFDDLRGSEESETELARLTRKEALAPFDLADGPLVRGRLVCLRDDVHVLFVAMHHIVSDGWSISVLFRELTALYTAFSQGKPDPLPPLPLQYADYAHWQRQWMQGAVLQTQLKFWRACLADAPALLELPTDRPRPAVQSDAGASIAIEVDATLTKQLKTLSQRHGTTLFMTLLAGWALLLSRLAGQTDIVIGSPVAGRQRTELEPLIGLFVNTLALRVDLGQAPTVAELLRRVKESTVAAQAHQDVPFEQVVELLSPVRSLAHSPLFQVMFSWQNTPERRLELPGLRLEALASPQVTAKFDLSLSLEESDDTIRGSIDYATALFDRASVDRHLAQWKLVLEAMTADDRQRISGIALLTAEERRHMLADWNGAAGGFPHRPFLPHWFAEQAARTPHAVALVEGSVQFTYSELNSQANRLAHYLIGLGAQPETRIAVAIPRGIDMVVGILAILKSGAAYVPTDPAYPVQRLAYLLSDCGPAVLLTHSACRHVRQAAPETVRCVEIDTGTRDWHACSDNAPTIALRADHLAYMIYTSGSTGRPKGVMIEHGALHNYLQWAVRTYRPLKGSVVSSSVAFDATITSLYTPLLCGASVTLLAEGDDVDGLEACLRSPAGAGLVKITPAHLDLLGRRIEAAGAQCSVDLAVDLFVIGGEALAPATVQLWQRIAPSARLVNEYGPTETVVGCASYEVTPADHALGIPIGRPIANMRMYVLDDDRQPVPLGTTGELYIGGAGVGRGYWQRPDLTEERFIADPFGSIPGARLYKTGDLGRWRADGQLEYLGRNDFQVKIRGFRIELGEIEAQLAAIPGVREAAVIAREDVAADVRAHPKRLVAYYRGADTLDAAQLRQRLAGHLPDYMLPAAYVKLASWPLTPNGKLDRQALPRPEGDVHAQRAYRAPEGNTELAIARIWQELLGVERVGRDDHFFELGGHSLLAIQVVGRLRDRLGRDVAVRALFAAPVLASFADIVRRSNTAMLPAITAAERTGPLPLSPMQQRLWMLDQFDPDANAAYHMPAGLRLLGKLDRQALQAAFDRLLARHDSLRTTFATRDGRACQVIAETSSFVLEEIDLRAMADEARQAETERLTIDVLEAPFDLSAGPLIRGRLLRLDDEEHILLVNQHHIVSDGWSIGVMIDEFNALYAAFSQGKPDPLPALPIQYADYAIWQLRCLEGETRQAHLDFWRGHLAGAPPLLALPTDRPRPAAQSYAGALFEFSLDAGLRSNLEHLSRQQGCTMFMTMLAGWAVLMARMAAQDDVVIGTPVANRQHAEVEGLIGFFVNTLALRVQLQPELSVADLLEQVKASTLAAYAHQDLPFEQVVDALQPVRSAGHSPLFQVMLAWDNTPAKADIALPGLTVAPLRLPHTSTQFDLSLSLRETDEGILGSLEYATDLFDEASMARLAGCWCHLLRAMALEPQQPVAGLPLLDDAARRQLLVDFNNSAVDFPLDRTYADLFARQVARNPGKIAAVCGDDSLTYAELEARTARLAQALLAAGAKRETVVALAGKRDLSLLGMMIAVLRTGAAFLTLDVKQPAERLRAVLQASGAPLVLVSQSSQDLLDEVTQGLDVAPRRLVAEALWQHDTGVAFSAPPGTPDDLAYIIFTSGSTGQPKGVMIEQSGMLNNMFGKVPVVGLSASDRVAQTASPAFDIYVWQFLAAPLVGATVHILADDVVQDPALLVSAIEQQQLSLLEAVPSMLRSLLDTAPASANLASLRWVLPTGEALPLKLAQDWFARFTAISLMNMYGPAECSDDVAFHAMTARPEGAIPIGRPTPNNQLFILDSDLRPVPIGVQGEICVAGAGVGRGYCNIDRSQAFADHPFSPGARFYRTGDLGRYRSDGVIEYLGRNDFQVKIRGCRIELGEVEARLLACEGVADAVVTARADTGEQRLVGYVVARPDSSVSPATLRAQLSSSLPDFMVPSAFVILPAFPRTPNGKLDRRALPAPDASAMHTRAYQAPLGQVESTLARLWQDLLGVERVGRHDNFFELGGHSLKAITLVTRMREEFEIAVPLRSVFEHAELAQLADHVTASQIGLYLNNEMAEMALDLDAMSEDELLAMLEEESDNG